MTEEVGISAGKILELAFKKLTVDGRKIEFPRFVKAIIGDDSDMHRSRTGYIKYDFAFVIEVADKRWLVAYGEKWGSYPADPYDHDLLMTELETKNKESEAKTAESILERNRFFKSSIIFSLASGEFSANQSSHLGMIMLERLSQIISNYFTQRIERDPEHYTMDLRKMVTQCARYKPELADRIVEIIKENILTD